MFGEIVRAHRQRLGATQAELAERTGLSERNLRNIESGRITTPRASTVRQLADAFALYGEDRERFLRAASNTRTNSPPEFTSGWPSPAQLPADVAGFTGRTDEMRVLTAWLEDHAQAVVVTGTAGVGKTALTVHWAHRVADRFPDGHLHIDLRGHTAGPQLHAHDALARFLRALGIAPTSVPVDTDEAAALYRSLLADRRMLVLVDNAARSDQVRPLLPGQGRSLTVVTSRNELAGLTARDGARHLAVNVFSSTDAEVLLSRLLGENRVSAEPDSTRELARLCGNLPLALRIAAANLTSTRTHTIGSYVARLNTGDRLTMLQVADDPDAAVQAAFDLSYDAVPAPAQRLFRLLGLLPGPDFTPGAAAAIAGASRESIQPPLDDLVRAHLVALHQPDRYTFHDLLRLHARRCAAAAETEHERHSAVHRLLDWYCDTALDAVELLYPQKLRLPQPVRHSRPPEFASDAAALAWLDAERLNLVAAVLHTAEHGPRDAACRLADILRAYFFHTLHLVDWLAVAETAEAAARADGNQRAQAAAHLSLADLHWRRGEHRRATEHTTWALRHAVDTGWAEGEAAVHGTLGGICWRSGELDAAIDHLQQALALNRRTGRLTGQAINLSNLGLIRAERGDLTAARDHHIAALALHAGIEGNAGHAVALINLGETEYLMGDIPRSIELLTEAVTRTHEVGDRVHEAEALRCLATARCDLGQHQEALDLVDRARACLVDKDFRRGEAEILTSLATILARQGQHRRAILHYQQALAVSRHSGDRHPENTALLGLADAHLHLGDLDSAASVATEALTTARRAGFRVLEGQAEELLARLAHRRNQRTTALAHAEKALALHKRCGCAPAETRVRALLSDVLQERPQDSSPQVQRDRAARRSHGQ
ncbi:ATP-binding protein [Lentzea aerocolonigenes]|uniref:ATP-binding protein n=1 Tax=Lentzea aerocolonigenes TaxID=68170 RepID=UPI0007515979|nr:tetratricopeptide repeat protein [Lentzea aerocolonigenes]MCP2245571.1 Tetratricopeptide repeat-containing protein [Lentzea aerocolonigenes]